MVRGTASALAWHRSACSPKPAAERLLQVGVEAAQRPFRHARGGVRLQAQGAAGPPIHDDIDSGVVEPDAASTFACCRHNRRRQGCDRFVRPLRAEVLWIATSWRLLEVGRHHATVEKAHAIFGSIWNEFLEKVVASPLAPRGVVRDHRLSATPRALALLGNDA